MAITVTIANAEALSTSSENDFFDITFTNTSAFSYAASSNIYFYALLTDSTSGTPLTREVTFTVSKATSGTIEADTPQTFTLENTTNLVPTVTASNGRILYLAQ